jgi:hypothetical protein
MPELCRFQGLIIRIFAEEGERHHIPHIHVKCGEDEASISLDGDVLAGRLPPNKLRMVQVWLDLRADQVRAAWERVVNDIPPGKIAPLV